MAQANRVGLGEYIYSRNTLYERIREYYPRVWGEPIAEDIFAGIVRVLPESNFFGWWSFEEDVLPILSRKEFAPEKSQTTAYAKQQTEKISALAREASQEAVTQAQATVDSAAQAALREKQAKDEAEKSRRTWQIVAGVAIVGAGIYFYMKRRK
jgi:hypothetical protein